MEVENRRALAERLHDLGASAVVITGGHGERPVEHFFDGEHHLEIPVPRHEIGATHGAGCTHSATLAALLARGEELQAAVGVAPMVAAWAVEHGLDGLGSGDGPVDVFNLKGSR
jgi:hydroxymethylpyrimidine/phosphomethylpyrimidine kinase